MLDLEKRGRILCSGSIPVSDTSGPHYGSLVGVRTREYSFNDQLSHSPSPNLTGFLGKLGKKLEERLVTAMQLVSPQTGSVRNIGSASHKYIHRKSCPEDLYKAEWKA